MGIIDPGAASITVAVRVRPFTIREAAQLVRNDDGNLFLGDGSLAAAPTPKLKQHGLRSVIKVVDDRCLVFDPPEDNPVQKFSRSVVPTIGKKVKDQVFAFDRIFDDNANQTDVYEATTKPLLDSVLDGYNATVFAYGATGCGKTHTITGTAQHPGIIFLTMQELFEKINERSDEKVTELSLSYLEIYNETIRDLLVPGGSKAGLMLREDSNQAVTVSGLTSHHPKDVQEVMDMIVQGNEYRTVSPTEANATSSRSHAVLQINIAQKDRNADVNEPHTMATLSIIDLAGSERASATKNRGERLIEGANINKSLLALGSCINALCDPRKKNHVPYRNSKLTRLLKFSLGGNCKTVMIVCVSPSSAHFDETQNTLRYANRAKNIQTKVTRNVFNVNRHVKDFLVKIDEQMALINELKAQQKDAEHIFYAKFRKQLEKRDGVAREGVARIRAAYDHSSAERQEKLTNMKKLRAFERRIGLLSAWIAAFDTTCDTRGDEDTMPPNLVTIRKTAHGVLAELENSRQHLHKRIEKSNWERAVDTALQHSIAQLSSGDNVVDNGEVANLTREAEQLKSNFMREAYREILDMDRSGDASTVQVLLQAQFEILSSLSETLTMSEDEVVEHAKGIINRMLETGYSAVSHIVKPDGSMAPVEMFPPTKRGTPKRKRASLSAHAKVKVAPPAFAALSAAQQQVLTGTPMKASPRRRKQGASKKGVSFTPKKKSPSRRMVRWRDDESEQGTLADYEKTPQKFDSTPEQPSPAKAMTTSASATAQSPVSPVPVYLNRPDAAAESGSESSPSLIVPEATSLLAAKPNRFQAGFLSKGVARSSSGAGQGSPVAPTLSLPLLTSTPESDKKKRSFSPLRAIDAAKAGNTLSPGASSNFGLRKSSGGSPRIPRLTSLDENTPLTSGLRAPSPRTSFSASCSDSESSTLASSMVDPHKLRAAIHSAKRRDRLSLMSGTATSNAKRISSVGSNASSTAPSHHHANTSGSGSGGSHHRPSSSYSGPPPPSSTNGISRQRRRNSAERRRSPPIVCSPPGSDSGSGSGREYGNRSRSGPGSGAHHNPGPSGRSFTPGQARRPNFGGSVRGGGAHDASVSGGGGNLSSPRDAKLDAKNARRITIGSSAAGLGAAPISGGGGGGGSGGSLRKELTHRPSVIWR